MLSKNMETYLDTDSDADEALKPILDAIHYLELESGKLGHFKIASLLKKARNHSDNENAAIETYSEKKSQTHGYLPILQKLKTMQKGLEDAGLSDESEIIKLAIMSLFAKYDPQNLTLNRIN